MKLVYLRCFFTFFTLHKKNIFISSLSSPHNVSAHKKSAVSKRKDTDTDTEQVYKREHGQIKREESKTKWKRFRKRLLVN